MMGRHRGIRVVWVGAGLLALITLVSQPPMQAGQTATPASVDGNWTTFLGDQSRTNYSRLTQITKANVSRLEVAWTYDTGDRGEFQANNLIVDGVLYTASPMRKVIALDATTGRELWKWDPAVERPGEAVGNRQRGVTYWKDPQGPSARIFTPAGRYLYALDAKTGQVVREFADNGALHLGKDLDVEGNPDLPMLLGTPMIVYKDLLIMGSNPGETAGAPPGHIRAYDVRTGVRRWIFHTIPHPGEFGADTWPDGYYKNGAAANSWAGLALDEARGILFVPTGSPGGDFWGEYRPGQNLFANSLVALDANTGRRLWHFQIVHHDQWDRDLPMPPVLMSVRQNGRLVDVVVQGTKIGRIFAFNRVTGEPLWPIEERPVQQSAIPGLRTWPTQPVPTRPRPLVRGPLTEADASNVSREAQAMSALRLRLAPDGGPYPAPSTRDAVFFPGFDGGMEWGGAAADTHGVYYVNVNEMPWAYQMVPTHRPDGSALSLGERTYLTQCGACHGQNRQGEAGSGIPGLVDLTMRRTKADVTRIVESGTGGRMPAFTQLPEGQRRAVVDWLFGDEQPAAAYAAPGRGGAPTPSPQDPPFAFRGFQRWVDAEGFPAIRPPWGTMNAVDMNTGDIKWQVPLGEYPALTARGIPPTGRENYGGPVVTASGLVFIAATGDETIRAFDAETGRVLWRASLPFSGFATPSTYAVNGRQYVVISAGGTKSGRPSGGSIVAFALPRQAVAER